MVKYYYKSIHERTEKLIGEKNMITLKNCGVIVFGLGGVGGYVVEALARTGVGRISIVDYDIVDATNINRQIIALSSTVGKYKTELFKDRIADINEEIKVAAFREKLTTENVADYYLEHYDYIVDAIDDVAAKIVLMERAKALGISIISSMGTGNKMDPARFRISDISETHTCPLAKKVRKEAAARGLTGVKVLFSDEKPERHDNTGGSPASISFVPATAGFLIAGEVIRDLIRGAKDGREEFYTGN